jgi:hypothetical protein
MGQLQLSYLENCLHIMIMMKTIQVFIFFGLLSISGSLLADEREQAKRIHDRLTGVPPSEAMLVAMADAITSGDSALAAEYAMDGAPALSGNPAVPATGHFYTTTLKNWVTPWTNEAADPFAPLNDYSATVIGIVRDEVDFRQILSGNIIYTGNVSGIPLYSPSNNNHYAFLESAAANLGDDTVLVGGVQSQVTGLPVNAVAGVMTTRAAARAFFTDGTNRAMFRFTLLNHWCTDLEQLKDTGLPTDRIRQDVSRSPGGDSSLFLNQCVGCHSGMDPMAQAFAYYEFPYPSDEDLPGVEEEDRKDRGQILYTIGAVQDKYHINENNFVYGYITPNDHWTNYWRLGDNSGKIGWLNTPSKPANSLALNDAYSEGDGAASLGAELANTEAFAHCQVKKVFREVCLREPMESEKSEVDGFVGDFKSAYNIKNVFAEVAGYCSSHLN